jgi:hypothetical protein
MGWTSAFSFGSSPRRILVERESEGRGQCAAGRVDPHARGEHGTQQVAHDETLRTGGREVTLGATPLCSLEGAVATGGGNRS